MLRHKSVNIIDKGEELLMVTGLHICTKWQVGGVES